MRRVNWQVDGSTESSSFTVGVAQSQEDILLFHRRVICQIHESSVRRSLLKEIFTSKSEVHTAAAIWVVQINIYFFNLQVSIYTP